MAIRQSEPTEYKVTVVNGTGSIDALLDMVAKFALEHAEREGLLKSNNRTRKLPGEVRGSGKDAAGQGT